MKPSSAARLVPGPRLPAEPGPNRFEENVKVRMGVRLSVTDWLAEGQAMRESR